MTTSNGEEIVRSVDSNVMSAATPASEGVFLVATKAVVLRKDGKMLTMLRGQNAPTNALKWDLPGGILEHGEEADKGVIRETKEETGLDIVAPRVFHAIARANRIGEHWTTIFSVAHVDTNDVTLSWEHDEFKWILPEEFDTMDASKRNKEAVAYFIALRDAGKI